MSLLIPSDGLLNTHVTWNQVESDLQRSLKTNAKLGKNKTISHIGEGNGFLSRIGLITCEWEGVNPSENLPARFALKMATMLATTGISEQIGDSFHYEEVTKQDEMMEKWASFVKESHNNEVETYRLLNKMGGDIPVPKCYYSVPFSDKNTLDGSIALEFLENTKSYHIHQNMSVDQLTEIARELGKIHALSITNSIEKEETLSTDIWTKFWFPFTPEGFVDIMEAREMMDGRMEEILKEVIPLVPKYFGTTLPQTIHEQFGCGRVLVNGDHWSANVLFDGDSGDLKAIIDWQLSHFGIGVEDLLRITMSSLSTQDRRSSSTHLLNTMYDSMKENLRGAKAPYTREQLFELYDILFPHAAFFFAPVLTPVFMATISKGETSEERDEMKGIIVEKLRGIYEDVVVYDAKNEKDGRNFKFR